MAGFKGVRDGGIYRVGDRLLFQRLHHQNAGADGRKRIDDVQAGIFRCRAANRLEHRDAFRVDVAARRNPHAALNHRAEVGDDVAEHVFRHNHVEPFGIFDHPHRHRVHVVIFARDVRVILRADFLMHPKPEIAAIGQHVGFVR